MSANFYLDVIRGNGAKRLFLDPSRLMAAPMSVLKKWFEDFDNENLERQHEYVLEMTKELLDQWGKKPSPKLAREMIVCQRDKTGERDDVLPTPLT